MSNDATKTGRFGPGANQSNVPQEKPKLANMLLVSIVSVRHKDQRYDTCGDWYKLEPNHLIIKVSETKDRREMFLVAIHELIEAFLCECAGVSEADVDKHDLQFEKEKSADWGDNIKADEPGDDCRAPYYKQHQLATGIERILAAEVGVSWLEYEKHIEELS